MRNNTTSTLIDAAMACVLSLSIYLVGSIGIIPEMSSWFYLFFTPIIFLLLIKKRKREEENNDK